MANISLLWVTWVLQLTFSPQCLSECLTSLLSKMFVCLIVCMFGILYYNFRIRRYLPCCADEAVHTSWLRKLTEADLKNNNLESGGSNCENPKICAKHSSNLQSKQPDRKYFQFLIEKSLCTAFTFEGFTCRSLWDVTQCPPTPSTLIMSCLCGRSFVSSDSSSCRRTFSKHIVQFQCWYMEYMVAVISVLSQTLPPESMMISTPNPPVSSRTTDSRSDEPL